MNIVTLLIYFPNSNMIESETIKCNREDILIHCFICWLVKYT